MILGPDGPCCVIAIIERNLMNLPAIRAFQQKVVSSSEPQIELLKLTNERVRYLSHKSDGFADTHT
jgi:hypothetical protein